jgi:SSS family transporter
MNFLDFAVLLGTMLTIVLYGIWKTRGSRGLEGYLKGNNTMGWGTIGLSVMATQASAITFLSTPGQAFTDGMGFVQIYFGMPFAIIIVAAYVVPMYHKLKVYTAYEFLENRFDLKSRVLAAFLFLISRGLAAGITIYAPAIIMTSILGWDINLTILIIGALVIIYTVSGGTKAVAETQKYQMLVIMAGMVIAFIVLLMKLPEGMGLNKALLVAGKLGKMEVIDLKFDPTSRYNIWSGLFAAFFLSLSYFGADQSQVQRYISGKSIREIRLGLLFNGFFKIPMQFSILLVGVLVFVFYQFVQPPMFFNQVELDQARNSIYAQEVGLLEKEHTDIFNSKKIVLEKLVVADANQNLLEVKRLSKEANELGARQATVKADLITILQKVDPDLDAKDSDYVFISWVLKYLPHGIIGLLIAVIFAAAMSSSSSELNALGSTTVIDFYKRMVNPAGTDSHYLFMSRLFTVFWGVLALLFAVFASQLDNLIQAVNIVGSVFYGPILGIFIVAFAFKSIKANAVFIATILSELVILVLFFMIQAGVFELGYLWFNPIGALLVVLIGLSLQKLLEGK